MKELLIKEIAILEEHIKIKKQKIHDLLREEVVQITRQQLIDRIKESGKERLCVARPSIMRITSKNDYILDYTYALVRDDKLIVGGFEHNDQYRGNIFYTYKDNRSW